MRLQHSHPWTEPTIYVYYVMLFAPSRFIRLHNPLFSTPSHKMASKWPPLNDVERLSDRVVRILGQNPGKVRDST